MTQFVLAIIISIAVLVFLIVKLNVHPVISLFVGGMLCGCSRTAAAEFTFFLAIPVMFGWGLVKAVKFVLGGLAMTQTEVVVLVVGIATAFVMSVVSIKFLMGYIKRNDFKVFGWYRIVLGVLVLAYFLIFG